MYGAAGANRPIFTESDAYFYNLDDPTVMRPWQTSDGGGDYPCRSVHNEHPDRGMTPFTDLFIDVTRIVYGLVYRYHIYRGSLPSARRSGPNRSCSLSNVDTRTYPPIDEISSIE